MVKKNDPWDWSQAYQETKKFARGMFMVSGPEGKKIWPLGSIPMSIKIVLLYWSHMLNVQLWDWSHRLNSNHWDWSRHYIGTWYHDLNKFYIGLGILLSLSSVYWWIFLSVIDFSQNERFHHNNEFSSIFHHLYKSSFLSFIHFIRSFRPFISSIHIISSFHPFLTYNNFIHSFHPLILSILFHPSISFIIHFIHLLFHLIYSPQ